jgi:tRNA A-37 threonylcarbamoyl transferase component Bud32
MRPLETGMQLREYRLEHRIGRGGEGDVWLALHMRGQPVALKARPHTDDQDAHRFRAEFARLRTLRIPGVVRVLDVGADQGYLFFTMEVAEGVPFDKFASSINSMKRRIQRVSAAGAQVSRALASIHRLGLAHRDIKPANIHVTTTLVEGDLEAIVLDFGTHHFGHSSDDTQNIRGTPAYMAPEQRLGMPHDHRVDIYSLGTVLFEAISREDARKLSPGQRRPSLVGLSPEVPPALGHLVDRMLDLDPADRPSAEEAEAILHGVAHGTYLPPATWPKPVFTGSDVKPLLENSRGVHGTLGDGVARYIATCRWHWYRKGYTSVMGRCDPSRPFSAWVTILGQLFGQRSAGQRALLAGAELPVLHGIWPEIPQPCDQPHVHVPEPDVAAQAIARVLNRCGPIAVVIHDLHQADPGMVATIQSVHADLDPRNRLWVTSATPETVLEAATLPAWTEETHRIGWAELLGERVPCPPVAKNGRDFLRVAWTELAKERNEPEILHPVPISLQRLSVLRQPFPHTVAVQIAPDLNTWIEEGQLVTVSEATEYASALIRFASEATRTFAKAELADVAASHKLAAIAWGRFPEADEAIRERVKHLLLGQMATPEDLISVVQLEVNSEHPHQVRRWIDLLRLHVGSQRFNDRATVFEARYALLYSQLYIAPNTIHMDDVRELAVQADDVRSRGLAAHLKLAHAIRTGEAKDVVTDGRRWAQSISISHPIMAARMYREIALASLGTRRNHAAIRDSRCALELARKGAEVLAGPDEPTEGEATLTGPPRRLTQTEIDAATTYSAALVYACEPEEAAHLCHTMFRRCHRSGHHRGAAAFLINQGIALHRVGKRTEAIDALAEARAMQHLHGDATVFANQAVVSARLAVERSDPAAANLLLDEAITAGIGIDDPDLLAEAWTSVLDLATQTGSIIEARRALSTYGVDGVWSARDHWPAVLARWHWARGRIDDAIAATEETRQGYGGACVHAERARLLLISGNREAAVECANALLRHPEATQFSELHVFAQLVLGAASKEPDVAFQPWIAATRDSRWVHLYLGALHLDAIRRRSRGENVMPLLRQLSARAVDLRHRMYQALANPQGW